MAKLESIVRMVKHLLRHRVIPTFRANYGERSMEFSEYRLYRAGDDPSRLDWNVYRRLDELVVKEYVYQAPNHWMIVLDVSNSMGFYRKFEVARQMAAALLYLGVSLVGHVTFYAFPGQTKSLSIANKSGIKKLLASLELLQASSSGESIPFTSVISQIPPYTTVILISDLYGTSHREIFKPLKLKHMLGVAIHILSREEKYPTLRGRVTLRDAETGASIQTDIESAAVGQYQKRLLQHVNEIKSFCHQNRVFYKEIDIIQDLEKTVLQVLKLTGLIR